MRPAVWGALLSAALFAVIGIELAVLAALVPTTLEQWWTVSSPGDFANFYNDAQNLNVNGLYSPGLSLLMYPLTFLSTVNAYRVYVALGALAFLGVAYLAQREVELPEAKVAVALGVLSIPQMHWGLRLGHMTAFLALAALGGFLLLKKRPFVAGLCFALLILKPQYAVVPVMYLLWTRNWPALGGMAAGSLGITLVGFAAVGFGEVGPYIGTFFDLSADTRDNLLPYQRSWQYAWQGFLISAGIEPHPLVVIDLSILSLCVVVVAWARGTRTAALVAAALGMLLVTPYANFYDWGLIVVAGALLLRADLAWKPAVPLMLGALYVALLASQAATPFPAVDVQVGVIGADGSVSALPASYVSPTDGLYWITPLALVIAAIMAFTAMRIGSRELDVAVDQDAARPAWPRVGATSLLAMALLIVPGAFVAAAYYGEAPPFEREYDPYAPSEIRKKVPADFPLPEDAELLVARRGEELPFHLEWRSAQPVNAISPLYEDLLAGSSGWELMLAESTEDSYRIRIGKSNEVGFLTHWAKLDVSPAVEGSLITLDLFVTEFLTVTSAAELEAGGAP